MSATEIRIGLPLPLDVVSSVVSAVGAVYPSARMGGGTSFGGSDLVLVIDDEHRKPRKIGKAKAAAVHASTDDPEGEPTLVAFHDDGITTGLPEDAARQLATICATWLDAYPGVNYLETTATYPDDDARYVVIACKSPKQTPHELRQQAERRADAAEAEVERLRAAIARVKGWCDELDARAVAIKGHGAAAYRERGVLAGLAEQCRAALIEGDDRG